uniref:Uncharacterized protein n=1 Tax=Arion vulgaris TaxID=1028688 RepID=A0A0B7B9G8_9EUPU
MDMIKLPTYALPFTTIAVFGIVLHHQYSSCPRRYCVYRSSTVPVIYAVTSFSTVSTVCYYIVMCYIDKIMDSAEETE